MKFLAASPVAAEIFRTGIAFVEHQCKFLCDQMPHPLGIAGAAGRLYYLVALVTDDGVQGRRLFAEKAR
jgi:hypothetical protein